MYDLIFEQKFATALATVLFAVFASLMAGARRLWFRGLMYSLAPAFGAAFYLVAFLGAPHPDSLDLIAGLLFELTFLVLYFCLLHRLHRDLCFVEVDRNVPQALKWTIVLQVVVALPNLFSGGFGVFSEGSRIDYLSTGSLPKYFTYAGLLISMVQASLLALLLSARGRLGALGLTAISLSFALSVLAGSKGGVFLWLLVIASLVDYRRARISVQKIMCIAILGVGAVLASSLIVADFFSLELSDFIELAASRFFLNNDARALALDMRTHLTADFSFFSEAFRSLGNLVGLAPRNDPLGVVLYTDGLSVMNGSGANTSFMALATYYFPTGYALWPAVLGMLGAWATAVVASKSVTAMGSPLRRVMAMSIWIACFLTFSQDFLAFQVLIPLAVLATLALLWRRVPTRDFEIRYQKNDRG